MSLPDEMEMHDVLCCVRLAETEALPNRDQVWTKLARAAAECCPKRGAVDRLCSQTFVGGALPGITLSS